MRRSRFYNIMDAARSRESMTTTCLVRVPELQKGLFLIRCY